MHRRISWLLVLIIAGIAPAEACAGASARWAGSGPYGLDDVVLENDLLKVIVRPRRGGRIVSLVDKRRGEDLVGWNAVQRNGRPDGGLFRDLAPSVPHPGEQKEALWSAKITDTGPHRATAVVRFRGQSSRTRGAELVKRFTLTWNVGALEVELEMANVGHGTVQLDWRTHHTVNVAGLSSADDLPSFQTSPVGVDRNRFNKWIDDFREGWLAYVAPKRKLGLAMLADYNELAKQLFWRDAKAPTIEWVYRSLNLGPGDRWRTKVWVTPTHGLVQVTNMTPCGVYAITATAGKLRCEIHAARTGRFRVRPHESLGLKEKFHHTAAGQWGVLEWDAQIKPNTWTRFVVHEPDQVWRALHVLVRRDASGTLKPKKPWAKRPGSITRSPVKTVAIKPRPTPRPTDRIAVLVMSTYQYTPSMVDRRPDPVEGRRISLGARDGLRWFLRDVPDIRVDVVTEIDFLDKLKHLYDYHVLVLNDFRAALVKPYAIDIARYVEAGGALVVIGGYGTFGGRADTYGTSRPIADLLPVEIVKTPDFVDQTPYPKVVRRFLYGGQPLVESVCPACGKTIRYHAGAMPIMPTLDWLGQGKTLRTAKAHPITAGLPLGTLAPSYHQVRAKRGATVIATVGNEPAIVVQNRGKGRVACVTIDDYRRLYVWAHTPQFYEQLVRWSADRLPPVMVETVTFDGRRIDVVLRNTTHQARTVKPEITVVHPDGMRARLQPGAMTIAPGGQGEWSGEIAGDRDAPGGGYKVCVRAGTHTGYALYRRRRHDPIRVRLRPMHKHHWVRGEAVDPGVEVTGPVPPGATIQATLTDVTTWRTGTKRLLLTRLPKKGLRLPLAIATANLAYGSYRYSVEVRDKPPRRRLGHDTMDVYVGRRVEPPFVVFWYGFAGYGGDYTTLGSIERLAQQTNVIFGPKLGRNNHFMPAVDRSVRLGVVHIPWANNATYRGPTGAGVNRCQRHPKKLAWVRPYLAERLTPLANLPAILGMYLDDEGRTEIHCDYEREAFAKQYGRPVPADPKTYAEQRMIADFNIESTRMLYRVNAEATRQANPRWHPYLLKAAFNNRNRFRGISIDENFDDMDSILIDVYPRNRLQVAHDLLFFNKLRSTGARLGKPAWVTGQCVYSRMDVIRMQFWLALGNNLRSISWYSIAAYYEDRFDLLAPYNKLAVRLAPLLGAWTKPFSPVGVLWSQAMFSRPVSRPYEDVLHHLSERLYEHDLYPELLVEDDIRSGRVDRCEALIVPGLEVTEPGIVPRLSAFAERKPLYVDANTTVTIAGARTLDLKELRGRITPRVETPTPGVYGEPLDARGMHYAVVFNMNTKPTPVAVRLNGSPDRAVAYDVVSHQRLATRVGRGVVLTQLELPAMEGTIVAWVPSVIDGVDVRVPERTDQGSPATVAVALRTGTLPTGLTPVELIVRDPAGRRTWYSGTHLASDGRLSVTLPIAVNDVPGRWTVTATDLLTGRSATAAMVVERATRGGE